jgi:hypothetical protein
MWKQSWSVSRYYPNFFMEILRKNPEHVSYIRGWSASHYTEMVGCVMCGNPYWGLRDMVERVSRGGASLSVGAL